VSKFVDISDTGPNINNTSIFEECANFVYCAAWNAIEQITISSITKTKKNIVPFLFLIIL